jgi:Uma2 family endonuclease
MVEKTFEITRPSGDVVAENFSEEDYLEYYAQHGYEWVKGYLIKMSPVTMLHDFLLRYLRNLLEAYLALNPIGIVLGDRFLQRIERIGSKREPDLQVILHTNPGKLTETAMMGAADICIEVVSSGSESTDFGDKYVEYEQGGVQEYWIIDTIRHETRFYRLQPNQRYQSVMPDADGYYRTPLLPRFALHIPTLWQDPLPDIFAVVKSVEAMFKQP